MKCSPLNRRRARVSATAVAFLVVASAGAHGEVTIVPRVSIAETLTDNVLLTNVGQQAEQITEISPGIRVNIKGARLKGYFDYSLSEVVYAQNSSPRRDRNALNTFGTLEAFDDWFFVDFSGNISQQAISAFGTQSVDDASVNTNKAEVSSYRLSPYVRGRLGNTASYEARYTRAVTSSDAAAASGVSAVDAVVKISGGSAFKNLGWSADASRQNVDYSAGRSTESDRLSLGLTYTITPQFNVFANAGREASNYTSFDKQSAGTSGFGLNWSPSEVSKLSAVRNRRPFGDTFSVSLEHRSARTAWRFSDSKDVSATPSQTSIASLGTIYDLFFNQFASLEPDPISRAQLVNTFLQTNGISPNATVTSSFLTSAVSLQRRQDLSFSLLGVRDTVTFMATRSEGSRLDTVSEALDDLATSALVRQRGFSVNFAHRLTPDYSMGVLLSKQITSGSKSEQDTSLRSVNFNVSGRLGKKASATVGARRVVSGGDAAPYAETAVTGNLTVQF